MSSRCVIVRLELGQSGRAVTHLLEHINRSGIVPQQLPSEDEPLLIRRWVLWMLSRQALLQRGHRGAVQRQTKGKVDIIRRGRTSNHQGDLVW